MADRLRKNWLTVLLGLVIVAAMVLGLIAQMFSNNQAAVAPTPTLIVYPTDTPAPTEETLLTTPTSSPDTGTPSPTPPARKTYAAMPPMTIDTTKQYTATIVTDKGDITLQLFPDVAPQTVNSFVTLARDGFYDGLTFHRVEDWVIQGGDPSGNGTGGPGYTLPDEFSSRKHITGTLAMARTAAPNSAGSQFYITKTAAPWLDNQYTIFGQTIAGMDVVDKIAVGDVIRKITIQGP
jgi:peptidylprolyl isomerase